MRVQRAVCLLAFVIMGSIGHASEQKTQEPDSSEKKPQFVIPCWHPDARWEISKTSKRLSVDLGENVHPAELDGPAGEAMWSGVGAVPSLCGHMTTGGRYNFLSFDEHSNRLHGVTCGAYGQMDGPFSRARFMVDNYVPRQNINERQSQDKRYVYLISGKWGAAKLRCLDFVKQYVTSLPTGSAPPRGIDVDEEGKIYVVNYAQELVIIDPKMDFKVVHLVKLKDWKEQEAFSGESCAIAVDAKNGRIYGNTSRKWHLWYWDIKDGSHHGLIKRISGWPELKGEPFRNPGHFVGGPGPFKGANFYAEGTVGFGPDDPNKRFIYMACCDDFNFYRLDLEREMVAVFDPKQGRFTEEGRGGPTTYFLLPRWWGNGSFGGWERVK